MRCHRCRHPPPPLPPPRSRRCAQIPRARPVTTLMSLRTHARRATQPATRAAALVLTSASPAPAPNTCGRPAAVRGPLARRGWQCMGGSKMLPGRLHASRRPVAAGAVGAVRAGGGDAVRAPAPPLAAAEGVTLSVSPRHACSPRSTARSQQLPNRLAQRHRARLPGVPQQLRRQVRRRHRQRLHHLPRPFERLPRNHPAHIRCGRNFWQGLHRHLQQGCTTKGGRRGARPAAARAPACRPRTRRWLARFPACPQQHSHSTHAS